MTTEQWIGLAAVVVPFLGSLVVAWLEHRGKKQAAGMVKALILGVEKALPSKGAAAPAGVTVKGAIESVAAELGVKDALWTRVKELTNPEDLTSPAQSPSAGSGRA